MNILTFKDIENLLQREDLKFYNFYNTDIDITNHLAAHHYLENKSDTHEVDQPIHIIFIDIEVYHEDRNIRFEFDKSEHPINAITIYDTKYKAFKSFYLLRSINQNKFNSDLIYYTDYLIKEKYIDETEKLEIFVYTDELQLLNECWEFIKQLDPLVISGFNSDLFDYPYIYKRLLKFYNKDQTAQILSKFGFVEFRNERLKIPDYPICDLLYLYKPRDDGGLSLGQKLPSYSLDAVSEIELNRNKLEYKCQVTDLSTFYEVDPTNFLLYNIIDVALCKLLNTKLQHIEQQNSLRRIMKISFSSSLIGTSALFEGYTFYKLSEVNKKVRHGLIAQNNKTIEESYLKNISKPITKKNEIKPLTIKSKEYSSLICRFDGAYVKEPKAQIIHDTVIDLDASIPPWEQIIIYRNGVIYWTSISEYDFKENDKTLTWDDDNNICWRNVLGKVSHPWSGLHGQLLKITTESNKSIIVTDNHSIFTIQQGSNTTIPYIIDAKKLKIGDYVVENTHNTVINLIPIKNIETIYYHGLVYDLSVDKTQRYFAGCGIGIHNTSLYPSKILESNIGFDTYKARILNPNVYKFLQQLELYLGIKPLPQVLFINILQLIENYVTKNKKKILNQTKFKQQMYYTVMFLLQHIIDSNIQIKYIYEPKSDDQHYLLLFYLIPLLDMINTLHPNKEAYNSFIYDHIFKNETEVKEKYPILYIIENVGGCSPIIKKLNTEDAIKFIQQYSYTICGTCFTKHEDQIGIYSDMLVTLSALRKSYRQKAIEFDPKSAEYAFCNMRQLAVKRVSNSSYGVFGLSSFRYSNHWLAQSITSQGRLTLKISQHLTELFLGQHYQ